MCNFMYITLLSLHYIQNSDELFENFNLKLKMIIIKIIIIMATLLLFKKCIFKINIS